MSENELYNIRVKQITKVVDGDTFDCILDLGFDVLLAGRVRMLGIDTPESRTRDLEEKLALETDAVSYTHLTLPTKRIV